MWKTLLWLAWRFDLDQSEPSHRNSMQVHSRPGQTESQLSRRKFSTCLLVYLQLHLAKLNIALKPWPNGLASRHKLKTLVYLRQHLARPWVHLRWLVMTWAHFGREQICMQVKASFSLSGHPTQVNASWVMPINLLLANETKDSLPQNVFS